MPDKRISDNPQIPKGKTPDVPAGRTLDNRNIMSNSTEVRNLQNTEQVNPQAAYAVLNRNGMINSIDPANQSLYLRPEDGEMAPVILPTAETMPHGQAGSIKERTAVKRDNESR